MSELLLINLLIVVFANALLVTLSNKVPFVWLVTHQILPYIIHQKLLQLLLVDTIIIVMYLVLLVSIILADY